MTMQTPTLLTRLYWTAYLAFHLRGQARYPFKPLDAILRDQSRRVRSIVAYAYRHVPYYRETMKRLGLTPDDFQTADDLARLPILEREQLQRDPEFFVSKAQPLQRYLRLCTSGSTGQPREIYQDTAALCQYRALHERERSIVTKLVGKPWGYRHLWIKSPQSTGYEMQRFMQDHRLSLPGVRLRREHLSLLDPADKVTRRLEALRPDVLQSFGSFIEILFAHWETAGRPAHLPKVITYTSDSVSDSIRHLILEKYGIPLLSTYQSIEAFRIGFECEQHRGLHANVDAFHLRLVNRDGQTLSSSVSGDVIVSNLVNQATVLLNYRLGDMAAWLLEKCPCGRSLPLLSFPQGRTDDLIVLPGNRVMHPQAVYNIFNHASGIWQYQVIQETATRFAVTLVISPRGNWPEIEQGIQAKFAAQFGPDIVVDMARADSLPRTAAGKLRPILSMLGALSTAKSNE